MALKGTIQSLFDGHLLHLKKSFTSGIFNALASILFPIRCLHVSSKDFWIANRKCNFDAIIASKLCYVFHHCDSDWETEWSPSQEKLIHDCCLKYSVSYCLGFDWYFSGLHWGLGISGYQNDACFQWHRVENLRKWFGKTKYESQKKITWFFSSFEYDEQQRMGQNEREKQEKILARKHWTLLSIDYNLMFRVPVQFSILYVDFIIFI